MSLCACRRCAAYVFKYSLKLSQVVEIAVYTCLQILLFARHSVNEELSCSSPCFFVVAQVTSLVQECEGFRMRLETVSKSSEAAELDLKANRSLIVAALLHTCTHVGNTYRHRHMCRGTGVHKGRTLLADSECLLIRMWFCSDPLQRNHSTTGG